MRGDVYNQSVCLVNEAAYGYYIERKPMAVLAEELGVSQPTVSRLIKRAEEEKLITFHLRESASECIRMERLLQGSFSLKRVLVVPYEENEADDEDVVKRRVALEGARYLQRVVTDNDVVGFAWGGTMSHLIQYLNPFQRKGAKMVTMHGNIENLDESFEVDVLVHRAAMAFGGEKEAISEKGKQTASDMEELAKTEKYRHFHDIFRTITISIAGVGAMSPETTTPLAKAEYLSEEELKRLRELDVCCDLVLRFLDSSGAECDTELKDCTYSIPLDLYREIPHKIVVASGPSKAMPVRAVLYGGHADVLIIDQALARELIAIADPDWKPEDPRES